MTESSPKSEPRNPSPEVLPFLLEVGCEEIPARFLSQAQKDLGEGVKVLLEVARLASLDPGSAEIQASNHESRVQTYSTPRRLIVYVPHILARQPDKLEEIAGPPVKVAVDAGGKFTRAAESFAQKNGASVEDLIRVTTAKGEHLALKKTTAGRPAHEVLGEVLPGVITGMNFPKSMYWEESGIRWVRPIRWLMALLGEGEAAKVVEFAIAGVKSGNLTFGHRVAGSGAISVTGFNDFAEKLRGANVEFDPESRRQTVRNELNVLLEVEFEHAPPHLNLKTEAWPVSEGLLEAVPDDDLENWIVNSAEWPSGILGEFNPRYLHLPREILVTVMRDHQKYFAVQDSTGNLQPRFIALLGRDRDTTGTIRAGHERVLTARFSDAEFFWKADQKIPLRDRSAMLEKVTYQAKLGTYADKVRRMEAVGKEICASLEKEGRFGAAPSADVQRAIELCKCDLTTQMVQEFTELQGVVGGLYARAQGELPEVADAIYDHYLPAGAEDKCPRSLAGAVVSLADKIDSVAAGFASGMAATGSSDPFGLRRAGNGIVKVLLEYQLKLPMTDLFLSTAFKPFAAGLPLPMEKVESLLKSFMAERIHYHLEGVLGYPFDAVRAVMKRARLGDPAETLLRLKALQGIRGSENMQALCHAAKRIKNILAKSGAEEDWQGGMIDLGLLADPPEIELERATGVAEHAAFELGDSGKYEEALAEIATLRPHVDLFFDKVLVMAPDKKVRLNRLRLLGRLDELFTSIADLSLIEGNTLTNVGASTVKDNGDQ